MNPPGGPDLPLPLDNFTLFPTLPAELRLMIWNIYGDDQDLPRVIDVQFFRRAEMGPSWFNSVVDRQEPAEPAFIPSMRSRPGPNAAPVMNTYCSEAWQNSLQRFPNFLFLPAFPGLPGNPRIRFNAARDTIFMDLGSVFALNQFWTRDHVQNTYHGTTYVGNRRSTIGFNDVQTLATPLDRPADGIQSGVVGVITNAQTRVTTIAHMPNALADIPSVITSVEQEHLRLSRSGIGPADQRALGRLFDAIVWDVTHFFRASPARTGLLGEFRAGRGRYRGRGGPNRLRGG